MFQRVGQKTKDGVDLLILRAESEITNKLRLFLLERNRKELNICARGLLDALTGVPRKTVRNPIAFQIWVLTILRDHARPISFCPSRAHSEAIIKAGFQQTLSAHALYKPISRTLTRVFMAVGADWNAGSAILDTKIAKSMPRNQLFDQRDPYTKAISKMR